MKTKKQEIREGLRIFIWNEYFGETWGSPEYALDMSRCMAAVKEILSMLDHLGVRIVNEEELPENPYTSRAIIIKDFAFVYQTAQQDMLKYLDERGRLINEGT